MPTLHELDIAYGSAIITSIAQGLLHLTRVKIPALMEPKTS